MRRVLVVDDDELMRGAVTDILTGAGHETVEAPDGQSASDRLSKGDIDLVVTDISMPDRDGLELIREITRNAPALPVIAMSGNHLDGVDVLAAARAFGAAACLEKPFRADTLLDALEKVLPAGD